MPDPIQPSSSNDRQQSHSGVAFEAAIRKLLMLVIVLLLPLIGLLVFLNWRKSTVVPDADTPVTVESVEAENRNSPST